MATTDSVQVIRDQIARELQAIETKRVALVGALRALGGVVKGLPIVKAERQERRKRAARQFNSEHYNAVVAEVTAHPQGVPAWRVRDNIAARGIETYGGAVHNHLKRAIGRGEIEACQEGYRPTLRGGGEIAQTTTELVGAH